MGVGLSHEHGEELIMEGVIRAIESEISRKEQELSALRGSLDNIKKLGEGQISIAASASGTTQPSRSRLFARQRVGPAVRQYMQARKSPATLEEIREALTSGGVKWGPYPKRQVALAVSTNPRVYAMEGDLVTLK
jgi:hypothetical protein